MDYKPWCDRARDLLNAFTTMPMGAFPILDGHHYGNDYMKWYAEYQNFLKELNDAEKKETGEPN
jgi:hypothetical protein